MHVALYHIQQVEPIFRLFHFRKRILPNGTGHMPRLRGQKLGIFQGRRPSTGSPTSRRGGAPRRARPRPSPACAPRPRRSAPSPRAARRAREATCSPRSPRGRTSTRAPAPPPASRARGASPSSRRRAARRSGLSPTSDCLRIVYGFFFLQKVLFRWYNTACAHEVCKT